jgi:hypothetical protein
MLLSSVCLQAQQVEFQLKDSLIGEYEKVSVDNLGRIYLVKNDIVVQFSKELDTLFTTSLKTIRPTSIESSKSFRTLLFDNDRSVIRFLDNTLTDIHGEIDLVSLDIQQPILVCESFGGNTIWVLDAGSLRLIKLNEKLEKVIITENLVSIFGNKDLPIQMKEANDMLYVLIPKIGVAYFDVFGTYLGMYDCDVESIDALDNHLLLRTKTELHIISNKHLLEAEFIYKIPDGIIDFVFTNQKVYLLKKTGLYMGQFAKSK